MSRYSSRPDYDHYYGGQPPSRRWTGERAHFTEPHTTTSRNDSARPSRSQDHSHYVRHGSSYTPYDTDVKPYYHRPHQSRTASRQSSGRSERPYRETRVVPARVAPQPRFRQSNMEFLTASLDAYDQAGDCDDQIPFLPTSSRTQTLPQTLPRTVETSFTTTRYLPLCRAMRTCLNKEGFALAQDVEAELLKENKNVFNWLGLDSFRQYVYEAKRKSVAINFALNVDDKVTKMYFCLTAGMISSQAETKTEEGWDHSGLQGPLLGARFMPLYRAIRKCISDQGYAYGADVDDSLMQEDLHVYHRLQHDNFFEYVTEAIALKSPLRALIEVDYVEKIWFCPTEGMLPDPFEGANWRQRSPEQSRSALPEVRTEESASQNRITFQEGFCVFDDQMGEEYRTEERGQRQTQSRNMEIDTVAKRELASGGIRIKSEPVSRGNETSLHRTTTVKEEEEEEEDELRTPEPRVRFSLDTDTNLSTNSKGRGSGDAELPETNETFSNSDSHRPRPEQEGVSGTILVVETGLNREAQRPLNATTAKVKREVVERIDEKKKAAFIVDDKDVKPFLAEHLRPEAQDIYHLVCLFLDLHLRSVSATTAAKHMTTSVAHIKKIVECSNKYPPNLLKFVCKENGEDTWIKALE